MQVTEYLSPVGHHRLEKPLPVDDQLRQRWNSAAATFLAAELQTGNTSVELAATSRKDENKIAYCRHAWAAYDAVLLLYSRVPLHEDEVMDIEIELALLKEKIEGIRPWGRLARHGHDGWPVLPPPFHSRPRMARLRQNGIRSARHAPQVQDTLQTDDCKGLRTRPRVG